MPDVAPSRRDYVIIADHTAASICSPEPEFDQPPDGLGFRWIVELFAARAERVFIASHLYQSFIPAKLSLYSISGPRLLFSIGQLALGRSTRTSRNSSGPLVSRRRRWACCSGGIEGSPILSIAFAARS
jgi:hypothetical protein